MLIRQILTVRLHFSTTACKEVYRPYVPEIAEYVPGAQGLQRAAEVAPASKQLGRAQSRHGMQSSSAKSISTCGALHSKDLRVHDFHVKNAVFHQRYTLDKLLGANDAIRNKKKN